MPGHRVRPDAGPAGSLLVVTIRANTVGPSIEGYQSSLPRCPPYGCAGKSLKRICGQVSARSRAVRSKDGRAAHEGRRPRSQEMIRMQSLVSVPGAAARRLHRLVEPIHLVTYLSDEPTDALMALGLRNYWDGYFAGRAAPLGRVPAEVVHAIFYNFADGEVARHIPRVWGTATPEAALAAREQGSVAALRRILGDLADAPGLRAPPTSPPGRRPARLRRDGSCTPRSGRSRYPSSPSPGSGTRPPCSASTAGTVISPPWWPRASAGRRPMCSTRSPRTSPRRNSEGSTTSLRTGWPGLWTGCRPAASSTPPAGSVRPAEDQGPDRVAHRRPGRTGVLQPRAERVRPARRRPRAHLRKPAPAGPLSPALTPGFDSS